MRNQHPFRVVQIQGDKVIGVAPLFNPFFAVSIPKGSFPDGVAEGKLYLVEGVFSDTNGVSDAIVSKI